MENKYLLPVEDVNDDKATITRLCFNDGDLVSKGDVIYEFETTKALVEVDAEHEGHIFYAVKVSKALKTGQVVCVITNNPNYQFAISNNPKPDASYMLTKKAQAFVEKNNLDLKDLDLSGIVREKDLAALLPNGSIGHEEHILFLSRSRNDVSYLLSNPEFRKLSSEEKIEWYRIQGHEIGENCKIGDGAVLIGNKITLGSNVSIAEGAYIESPEITLNNHVTIGRDTNLVASRLKLGAFTKVGDRVVIDISGGRNTDSSFICGTNCLIASESYVNVCHQVELGDHVALSPRSMIFTHSYWQSILDGYPAQFGPVSFARDSWLGAAAQVLPNVQIGEGAIVMSGSVLAKNVNAYELVGGIPAQVIKENINKKLSPSKKMTQLEELFADFNTHLRQHGFKSRLHSARKICLDDEGSITHLSLSQAYTQEDPNSILLVLEMDETGTSPAGEIYAIQQHRAYGAPSRVGRLLTEFLRRRGIYFIRSNYEQAYSLHSSTS